MGTRLELHDILLSIFAIPEDEQEEGGPTHSGRVYFQPPESLKIEYPCIIYKRDAMDMHHANNSLYVKKMRYQVKVIDGNPDSEIPDKVALLPLCRFDRNFATNGLTHDIFELYY